METIVIGEYNIQLQNETEYDGYNERTIVVNNNKVNKIIALYRFLIIILITYIIKHSCT